MIEFYIWLSFIIFLFVALFLYYVFIKHKEKELKQQPQRIPKNIWDYKEQLKKMGINIPNSYFVNLTKDLSQMFDKSIEDIEENFSYYNTLSNKRMKRFNRFKE